MTATFIGLPPIPAPPNDPTWWPLDPIAGWKDAQLTNVVQTADCGFLALAVASGGRSLSERSASFGGAALPRNIALGTDGALYLLDVKTPAIKRFDTCDCAFKTLPALSGIGSGPREISATCGGIGIDHGNLFICDAGNSRVSVWSQNELLLRAFWSPPAQANLANNWAPIAMAFDRSGHVYASDTANNAIHRFNAAGVWQKQIALPGPADALAFGCGNLYALSLSQGVVWVLDEHGSMLATVTSPSGLTGFPLPIMPVDVAGNLDLSAFCGQPAGSTVFSVSGNLLTGLPPAPPVVYSSPGSFISQPLDSSISRCVWHRIIMCADVPQGTTVTVSTFTAEAILPFDQIAALPPQAWSTNLTVFESCVAGAWDGLIMSAPGRYLWLQVTLASSGSATPLICKMRVEFPRISLRRYLPAVVGADPVSADFTDRFLALFDTVFRSIESTIDTQARFFDPMAAPSRKGEDFLSWLGTWVGVSFDRNWPDDVRRRYLKNAVKLYSIRGTREGLRQQILLILGIDLNGCYGQDARRTRCRQDPPNCVPPKPARCAWQPPELILEHFALRRWMLLGTGALGDAANVWGQSVVNRSQLDSNAQADVTQLVSTPDPERDPFLTYAYRYTVFVPAGFAKSDLQQRMLQNLLQSESPAYAAYDIKYIKPAFRIGTQSMIGYDTVVGCYPAGAAIGAAGLGSNSVLTA